jgi:CubicO group peptidase (beta-lactamase class C family)
MMNRILLSTILAAGWLAAAPAPQAPAGLDLPPTPAGRSVEAYLKSFNAGEEAMRSYFAEFAAKDALQQAPIELRLTRYRQMHERLGSLELRKVIEAKAELVRILAHGSNGPLVNLEFQFEPAEPFGLIGIRVMDAGMEGAPADPKKDAPDLAAAVRAYVRKLADDDAFSGVVLLAQGGVPIFEQAVGLADRERKIPNRLDTKFNIGSINKAFTALAVRQLTAQGKLSLDDPIGKYLPDYPNLEAALKVTVRHLVDMTSGIGDFFGDRYQAAPKDKLQSLKDYLPLFADKPLEFEPGSRNQYSNGGYVVLGLIVEKASGQDYYAYVREHIFKPAGMTDTDSYAKDADVANRARGYTRSGSGWIPNDDTLPGRGSSAGGGYSTAHDLLKYVAALQKGTLGKLPEDMQGGMGIAGGAPGLNAGVEWDPQRGYAIIVLANLDPPAAERIALQIRAWLPR